MALQQSHGGSVRRSSGRPQSTLERAITASCDEVAASCPKAAMRLRLSERAGAGASAPTPASGQHGFCR
ncbi:hypothetical protein BG57_03305 [Caballeronia grimmiae]|uniref:Uncharacterized protein n=1 Tax=Caballeronia grimmiae TaxID=1071679 RepID=A0A069PCG0_9BURK|nr:hypothetical protein BG57_03305 [Caballeronia grimmiae]